MLLKISLSLLILPLLLLMGFWGYEYAQVSSCIHVGGSFDYLTGQCLNAGAGIFVPFAQRWPTLVNLCLGASCLGLLGCLLGLYTPKG